MNERRKIDYETFSNILMNMKCDLQKNFMYFVPAPSLTYISLFKMANIIWRHKLKHSAVKQINNTNILEKMKTFEEEILQQISHIVIPINCREGLERRIVSIRENIVNFVASQLKFCDFTNSDHLIICLDNICWTSQGTINEVKTVKQIIEKRNLDTREKYILACNNCLEDKIRNLIKLLPENLIQEYENPNNQFSLVIFWTCFINGIYDSVVYDVLLKWSISNKKDTAVQYFWENFTPKPAKNYLNYAIKNNGSINIVNYFYQMISEDQRKIPCFSNINLFIKISQFSEWCTDIPIVEYLSELIRILSVHNAFATILFFLHFGLLQQRQFVVLWKEFLLNFKNDFEKKIIKLCEKYLNFFIMVCDIFIFKLVLNSGTSSERKKILFGSNAINLYDKLVVSKKWDRLNSLIALLERDEIPKIKKVFFDLKGINICTQLIIDNRYEEVNKFLVIFCTEENTSEFKKELPYKEDASILIRIYKKCVLDNVDHFTMWNKFLFWCFKENKEDISNCKAILFDFESNLNADHKSAFLLNLNYLIKEKQWEVVVKYLKWLYFDTKERSLSPKNKFSCLVKIVKFMFKCQHDRSCNKKFAKCYNILVRFIHLRDQGDIVREPTVLCFRYKDIFELLAKFISLCFKDDELMELKEEFIKSVKVIYIVADLLELDNIEEVDELIDWCCSSDTTKIDEFKIHYMLSSHGPPLLFNMIKYEFNTPKVKSLFHWFSPSQESANLFKNRFLTFLSNKRKFESQKIKQNEILKKGDWKFLSKRIEESLNLLTTFVKENR